MTLVRWNPVREVATFPGGILSMQREINRMFDNFFREGTEEDGGLFPSAWTPAVDLAERDNDFVMKMELPGVDRNDVKITLENNMLTIRGEKKQEKQAKESNLHRIERIYGSFQRSVSLPTSVRNDQVEAALQDGVLTVTLPKAEHAKPKQIEVKVK